MNLDENIRLWKKHTKIAKKIAVLELIFEAWNDYRKIEIFQNFRTSQLGRVARELHNSIAAIGVPILEVRKCAVVSAVETWRNFWKCWIF